MAQGLKPIGGYLVVTNPDVRLYGSFEGRLNAVERDTIMCGHCQRAIWAKPGTVSTVYLHFNRDLWVWEEVPGAACLQCMRPICLHCHDRGVCVPWERMLDVSEGRDTLTRATVAGFPSGL